jgi:hypothetical protein
MVRPAPGLPPVVGAGSELQRLRVSGVFMRREGGWRLLQITCPGGDARPRAPRFRRYRYCPGLGAAESGRGRSASGRRMTGASARQSAGRDMGA